MSRWTILPSLWNKENSYADSDDEDVDGGDDEEGEDHLGGEDGEGGLVGRHVDLLARHDVGDGEVPGDPGPEACLDLRRVGGGGLQVVAGGGGLGVRPELMWGPRTGEKSDELWSREWVNVKYKLHKFHINKSKTPNRPSDFVIRTLFTF